MMGRFPLKWSTMLLRQISAGLGVISLAGCANSSTPPPAVEIRTVTVVKEVQRPCKAIRPALPAKLVEPYPTDAVKLAIMLAEKLADYSGPGGYGERADQAIDICIKP
jgi:hypothetical protein